MMRNSRQARRMLEKFNLQDFPGVREVVIRTDKNEIILPKPSVARLEANGSATFMVTAESYEERELEAPTFSDEDVDMVCLQANVDKDRAIEALIDSKGDLARAVLQLTT